MPLKFLRAQSTRLVFILTMVCATQAPLVAQTPLLAGTYVQTFDAIGGGAPAGWGIYTGATASSLGTAATLNTAAASWASTTGQWANFAAAGSFLGTETVAAQAAAPNRALGIRQTGSFGDPGASAAFNFSTLGLQISSISFFAQLLSVQTRSTVWSLQYGVGAAPVSWTTIGTFSDPAVFGATTLTAAGFGTNLDNQPNVWLRIVALAGSTGSGSRDTFGIDDFTIVAGVPGGDIAPSIITEPQSLSVTEGGAAQFTVAASGTEPLVYQWRKGTTILSDAGNLTGTNSTMLTLSPVALADAGNYNVVVTNGAGSKTSMDAALTVNPAVSAPSITTQPAPTTVAPGGTAMFHVVADGTAPLAYQWRKGGANLIDGGIITGATTDTLTLTGISAADAGSFDVVVSNAVDSVASGPALLTVGSAPPVSSELLWNFTTATPSSGMPADVTNGTVTQGNNNGTTTLLTTTSASSGYAGVSGTFNAGAAAFVGGPLNQAVNTYFTFTLEPAAGKQLSASALSFGSRSTGTGPQAFAVFTSVDNFTTAVATGTLLNNSTWALQSPTFTSVTGGTSDPITFRIYGYGGAGSPAAGTANWRIDDLKLAISTVDGPPVPPAITGTTPAAGAVGIAEGSSVTVTFNQPVTVTGNWFTLTGSLSGAHTATVTGGATSYILTPDTPFTEGETITLVVLADHVVDAKSGTLALGSDYTATYTVISTRPIHAIQGSGLTSPFATQTVRVHGVVTAVFQTAGQIGGYYMEAPDAEQDTDATTSEGIYVFDSVNGVSVGDAVTVTGKLTEFGAAPNSETEISPVTVFAKESSGNALPTPIALTLPFASTTTAERYEGMRVILPQILTVTDTFDLGHFGELRLSNGRLPAPTNVVSPGGPAQLQEAANLLNQVILDDTLSPTYPSPTPYLNSSDASVATRRSGDTTTGVTGILGNKFGAYVIEPTVVPTFANANPRPTAPVVGGSLHVAIGNVLNFFNGNGTGQDGAAGGFPTERGATTRDEYLRQRAKMVAGILGLRPDIMGLTEVENDGFGPTSAIQDIVTSLNAAAPAGTTYALVNAGVAAIGTDAITCAFIYRTQAVELVGAPVINNDSVFNRPPIAQTFRQIATGEKLTVCINHFKSKGSAPSSGPNIDTGDGQSAWNLLRTQQANALTTWLATSPTGDADPDVLIIGDLNSYAKEDPISAIENAGYLNLTETAEGAGGYSYTFDGEFGHLDHALGSASLSSQVTGAATWHVNSDEPIYYDYNLENKDATQQAINVGTPYRYSDHDPVVIGLNLVSVPAITVQPVSATATVGTSVTLAVTASGTPVPTYQWRKNGVAIPGATGASFTIATPVVADSGLYDVVVTNALGFATSASITLTINPATASVTLGDLEQLYDGTPRTVTATTNPASLDVNFTYDGSASAPIYPGAYEVVGTIADPDYVGSAADTLVVTSTGLVRHAPALSGAIIGSLQVALPESFALNGSALISGDLLVPGTPTVVVNSGATYGGTLNATGSVSPSNYSVTLNKSTVLRHVVRRVAPPALPVVSNPPLPTGTRNVTLNAVGQSAGSFATLLNLTLNSKAGQVAVPPGTYGSFTANKNTGFVLGVAGAVSPTVYNLQALTLNGGSQLTVIGPVILTLAHGSSLAGTLGASAHPEWLELRIAAGDVSFTADAHAAVIAPTSAVTINATLTGSMVSDRLIINRTGLLQDPP